MKKRIKILSIFVLLSVFLSLYGFIVRYVTLGGERFGIFTQPIKFISSFPGLVTDVLKSDELKGVPPTFKPIDISFEQQNHLDDDLYGINSFYSPDGSKWEIKLFNFKNDSVIFTWCLNKEDFYKCGERKFENSRPKNSLILPDMSVIANNVESHNLFRLDRNSNIIWHNTSKNFHHSINLANDGNIWVPTSGDRAFYLGKNKNPLIFRDDFVTKIDAESGEILFDKGVSEILIENGYKNFVYGFSNTGEPQGEIDPIHLNDIQPAYKTTDYWKKGDLFLSLRHKSLVIHYRPQTNEIIRLIHGPFLFQHDIDLISDSEIVIFNNNTTNIGTFWEAGDDTSAKINIQDTLIYSEIIIYDYKDSSFRLYLKNQFENENIYTINEGSQEFLSNGNVAVESQNDSKFYILNENGIVLKKQFETEMEQLVYMPNWIRMYEDNNFKKLKQ